MKMGSSSISAITEVITSVLQKRDDDAQSAITGITTGTAVSPCNICPPAIHQPQLPPRMQEFHTAIAAPQAVAALAIILTRTLF